MPIKRNFLDYHKSINIELQISKDRIRNLIGSAHWPTDGEHKEAVIRKVLRNHLPETFRIGNGFICYPEGSSTQLDILITAKDKPTLFKDGELVFVTPDSAEAVIEVKTKIHSEKDLFEFTDKLADEIQKIRKRNKENVKKKNMTKEGHQRYVHDCKAGLFAYEDKMPRWDPHTVLKALQQSARREKSRIINFMAIGPDFFIRFWKDGSIVKSDVAGPVWHFYELRGLAQAYFVSNLVWSLSRDISTSMQYAWFPIEGTKEQHRNSYITLDSAEPHDFSYDRFPESATGDI